MGKYKKYAKTGENLGQPNKISSNNSNTNNFNQSNKMKNKKVQFNNKNELYKLSKGKYIKTDESSLREILWDIWDAMKYFFIMCKNFLIPSGISFRIFASFLFLELLYQGIIIYIINYVLFILNKYFSIWERATNMYIYIISHIQMFYIFICEGFLIFRFIHFKICIFQKLNWLINILTCIIIILNSISINELNSNIYKFYGNDLDLFNSKIIQYNIVNEYINLYVNKDYDFDKYEICNEIKLSERLFNKVKNKFFVYNWHFDSNLNLYIVCKNFSISNYPISGREYRPNIIFNCKNKYDVNTASNFCVSSKYRQIRFYCHLKIAFFEIAILILWNLYNYFSIKFIYHYYPIMKKDRQNNSSNVKNNYKTNGNVTYKDINEDVKDEDIYEEEYAEEEEENEQEEEEENEKLNNIKKFKIRKISKKKKSYKRKRNKNRYKVEKIKNKKNNIDEGILNEDIDEKNEDNNEEFSDKNEDDEDYFNIKNNFNEDNDDEISKEEDEDDVDFNGEEEEEEEEYNETYTNKEDKIEEIMKSFLKRIKRHQYLQKAFNFLIGSFIERIKNKIHQTFLEIDKDLSDESDENKDGEKK